MQTEEIFKQNEFSLSKQEKTKFLLSSLNRLTQHHQKKCPEYAKILKVLYPNFSKGQSLSDLPHLPVSLFKEVDLLSIPKEDVFKTLTSSGTTSSIPSRIFLDKDTAQRQVKALSCIMTSLLGKKRLPMLIVDHPAVIKNRLSFSARGAGILGMMNFGRDHLYALDDDMNLKVSAVSDWLKKYKNEKILIFGFTFMIWQYFLQKIKTSIPQGFLIHSGGWKKLQEIAVTNEKFKKTVKEKTGIAKTFSFYGMVEQVGSVFIECERGNMHCPNFADIIIRDPITWQPALEGVIQVLSALPTSYPGHSLLTEDMGKIKGEDSCPCGRMGKYFQIEGRVPKAELRGCSDTQ